MRLCVPRILLWVGLWAGLVCAVACGRPPIPEPSSGAQKLPFDQQPSTNGIVPSDSLVPSTDRIPEGTSLIVRLSKALSSATARAGDGFEGALEDAIVVDQQTLVVRGAAVNGRVLEAKRSAGSGNPGYLRITLTSINLAGKVVPIDTSSIFLKARDDRPSADRPSAGRGAATNDVVFTTDRRLTFRFGQAVELP